jgi:MinD superfamily P-loop ATPase
VDLDVEAPNAHLFLDPVWEGQETAYLPVPKVDEDACTRCGQCSDICQFKAIAVLGQAIVTFEPMCHGCAACWTICPEQCISQGRRELGQVSWGRAGSLNDLRLVMGKLRVGEAMSPPLMHKVMDRLETDGPVIIDAPPGTSCPAMASVGFASAVVLVTEPTPFGLYDLKLAAEAFSSLDIPMGVIINRAGLGDDKVTDFCLQKGLPVLARIPFDLEVARAYSRGERLVEVRPRLDHDLIRVWDHFQGQTAAGLKETGT